MQADDASTCDADLARWLDKQSNADLETLTRGQVPDELFRRAWHRLFVRHRLTAQLVAYREARMR